MGCVQTWGLSVKWTSFSTLSVPLHFSSTVSEERAATSTLCPGHEFRLVIVHPKGDKLASPLLLRL